MAPPRPAVTAASLLLATACQGCAADAIGPAPGHAFGLSSIGMSDRDLPQQGSRPNAGAVQPEYGEELFPAPIPPDIMIVESAGEGDLRLVRKEEIGSSGFVGGVLQVFLDGAFGAVCNHNFSPTDGDVACRQMGFVGGTTIGIFDALGRRAEFGRGQDLFAPIVLENLNCTGHEERLVDCPGVTEPFNDYYYREQSLGGFFGRCDAVRGNFAYVVCGNLTGPDDGDIRLGSGGASEDGSAQYGRLEIFANGGWTVVCDSNPASTFDPLPTSVVNTACKQLGFQGGVKTIVGSGAVGPAPIRLGVSRCSGAAESLEQCQGPSPNSRPSPMDNSGCRVSDFDPVGLVCFNSTDPGMEGSLRLTEGQAGTGYEYGRLEIFLRGVWHAVCDEDGFTPDSANVACSALGYDGGSIIEFRRPYVREGVNQVLASGLPVGLGSVDCVGNETFLLECPARNSVALTRNPFTPCRLTLDSPGDFTFTDAAVLACANMSSGCPAPPPPSQGSVQLRGGVGSTCDPVHTGFVEVFNDGEWGAICNRAVGSRGRARPLDSMTADVICRQLGFPHGSVVDPTQSGPRATPFGGFAEEAEEPQERFWLRENDVSCLGVEEKLSECNLGQGFLSGNGTAGPQCPQRPTRLTVACRSFAVPEALEAVTTPGAVEGSVRLVDESSVANWRLGRLELFFEGSWGQVCGAGFTAADANVACRQLDFGRGAVLPQPTSTRSIRRGDADERRMVYPEVAMAGGPGCTGSEETLLQCARAGGSSNSMPGGCFEPFNPGLRIACVAEEEVGEEGSLRLTDGGDDVNAPEAGVGVLEVFHAGAWGTVCNGDPREPPRFDNLDYGLNTAGIDEEAATVACRQLGFSRGEFRNFEHSRQAAAAMPLRPSWLADLPCTTGMEAGLQDCGALAFGDTATCGFAQKLICNDGTTDISLLTPRLVDGESDPEGAWTYGRLEVWDGAAFVAVSDAKFNEELGRRGVRVACRTLGFTAGGQALAGDGSALPWMDGRDGTVGNIGCNGDEESLSDCSSDIEAYLDSREFASNYDSDVFDSAVAIVCVNPSGCEASNTAPAQGDVRLVPINGSGTPTQPCDDVHLGAVEFFNDGQWGRVCFGNDLRSRTTWTVDAIVVCRQLGFPFGSLMDISDSSSRSAGGNFVDYSETLPSLPTWVSNVFCKGTEDRLDECSIPEGLGTSCSEPGDGDVCISRLSVICRRFPMDESDVIRRL